MAEKSTTQNDIDYQMSNNQQSIDSSIEEEKGKKCQKSYNIFILLVLIFLFGLFILPSFTNIFGCPIVCIRFLDQYIKPSESDNQIIPTIVYNTTRYPKLNCSEGFVGKYCEIECGLTPTQNNYVKIVGGQEAVQNSWPSIVYVAFNYRATIKVNNQDHTISQGSACGGTLLDKTTVLTAAHCIRDKITYVHPETNKITDYKVETNSFHSTIESMYYVFLGAHERPATLNGAVAVSKVIIHNDYNKTNLLSDIAILKLKTEATLDDTVQVACLPQTISNSYPKPVRESFAAGWGLIDNSLNAQHLMDVNLTIYNHTECKNVNQGYDKNWDSQICAGDLNGDKDTCQGDSGGPLFIQDKVGDKTDKLVVAGLTSYGVGCANYNIPGIYTRVSHYLEWIKDEMDQ